MKLRLYLPRTDAPTRSLGCILIAPAGSNRICGKPLDGPENEDEIAPYVRAGLAVVHFSLDGPIDDLQLATDASMGTAYQQFSAAAAGIVNARNAMAFVILHVPEVDRRRIYIAGHSSAGGLALLFAEHEPQIRGCIAFAPGIEPNPELAKLGRGFNTSQQFPGIESFVTRSAPITHVGTLSCPVFLFHGQGDTVVPISQSENYARTATAFGKDVTFSQVPDSHHYTLMVQQGIPRAIQWLKAKFGEPGDGRSAPEPKSIPQAKPESPDAIDPVPQKKPPPENRPTTVPEPLPVIPNHNSPRPPNPGERVVTLKFSSYDGSGDPLTAAQTALSGKPGADASVLLVDQRRRIIVVGNQAGSISTRVFVDSLQESGFKMLPGVTIGAWQP